MRAAEQVLRLKVVAWQGCFLFQGGSPGSVELLAFLGDHNKRLTAQIADLGKVREIEEPNTA